MKRSGSAVVSRSYILIWMLPFLLHCNYNCGCFNTRLVIGIIHSYMQCTILILSYLCFGMPLSVPACYQAVFSWSCWNNFCSCQMSAWVNYRKTPQCSIRYWPDLTTSLSCKMRFVSRLTDVRFVCSHWKWDIWAVQLMWDHSISSCVGCIPARLAFNSNVNLMRNKVINRRWPEIWQMRSCLSWKAKTNRFSCGFHCFVMNRIWQKKGRWLEILALYKIKSKFPWQLTPSVN